MLIFFHLSLLVNDELVVEHILFIDETVNTYFHLVDGLPVRSSNLFNRKDRYLVRFKGFPDLRTVSFNVKNVVFALAYELTQGRLLVLDVSFILANISLTL